MLHTHMLAIENIEPRRFYKQLNTFDRPLSTNLDVDDELVYNVGINGVRKPIIVFDAKTENQLWLVAGHRRLQAARTAEYSDIPAIVCKTFDELLKAMQASKAEERENDPALKPMLPSEMLQMGLVLRGIQTYCLRKEVYLTKRAKAKLSDFLPAIGVNDSDYRHLRILGCAYVSYDATLHEGSNVALATQLLAQLDKGELTPAQAYLRYSAGSQTHYVASRQAMAPAAWREQSKSIATSMTVLAEHIEPLRIVPADISAEELTEWKEELAKARRILDRIEKTINPLIKIKTGVTS